VYDRYALLFEDMKGHRAVQPKPMWASWAAEKPYAEGVGDEADPKLRR
jgi:hypothetical protein